MLKIGRNGELRLHRSSGTTARYGIRIKDGAIQFFDQLLREWHEYKSGADIPAPNGRAVRLIVEWADE